MRFEQLITSHRFRRLTYLESVFVALHRNASIDVVRSNYELRIPDPIVIRCARTALVASSVALRDARVGPFQICTNSGKLPDAEILKAKEAAPVITGLRTYWVNPVVFIKIETNLGATGWGEQGISAGAGPLNITSGPDGIALCHKRTLRTQKISLVC